MSKSAVTPDTPIVSVRGDALRRAVSVLRGVAAGQPGPMVTIESRHGTFRVGVRSAGDGGPDVALMLAGVTDGDLPPTVVPWESLARIPIRGAELHLRPAPGSLAVEQEGTAPAVLDARGTRDGPDLVGSRLSRYRSAGTLRADHACHLARVIGEGRGDPVDGVAVSPAGWAGTSDGEQLAVVPLEDWYHGRQVVVPGRLFRAALAFRPDCVTIEVNRRQDDPGLVRLVAFAGRDMLVLEDEAVAARFPDLREVMTEPRRAIVEVADAADLRAAMAQTGRSDSVLLRRNGKVAEVVGSGVGGGPTASPFAGSVEEPVRVRSSRLLDLLAGCEGPLVLSCDDQDHQPLCLSAGDGSLRGLRPLPTVG